MRLFVVHTDDKTVTSVAYDDMAKKKVGHVVGMVKGGTLQVGASSLEPRYRGQGIGKSLYEAIMAHSKNTMEAHTISGDIHSSMASAVHASLSKKHGMSYVAKPNIGKGRSYETKEDFDYGEDGPYDDKYREYEYTLKSEEDMIKASSEDGERLEKMAIADLRPGKETLPAPIPVKENSLFQHGPWYDYSHLLSPVLVNNGWTMHVQTEPSRENRHEVRAIVKRGDDKWEDSPYVHSGYLGFVEGVIHNGEKLEVEVARLARPHRGKGLGKAMYAAVMAHAHHVHGVRTVEGGEHSSLAAATHASIAKEHGLDYRPVPTVPSVNPLKEGANLRPFDYAYKPYRYTLKSEQPLEKMAIADLPPAKRQISRKVDGNLKMGVYDYAHLLPQEWSDKLGLKVHHIKAPSVGFNPFDGPQEHLVVHLHPKDDEDTTIGRVEGILYKDGFRPDSPTVLEPHASPLHDDYRNKGLGRAMYEAMYSHAYHKLRVRQVKGGRHTDSAHRVHQSLTKKHGLKLIGGAPLEYTVPDDQYPRKPYTYILKEEQKMTKAVRIPTVVRPPPSRHNVVLPAGSHKEGAAADAHPHRRSGQVKTSENGMERWRQVRAGMVKNPQTGEAISSREVPKSDKQPDPGGA